MPEGEGHCQTVPAMPKLSKLAATLVPVDTTALTLFAQLEQ